MTHPFCRPQDIPRDDRAHEESVTESCCCRPRHRFTNTFFTLFLCIVSTSSPVTPHLMHLFYTINSRSKHINCTYHWIRQMPAQAQGSAFRQQRSPLICPLNKVKQSGDVHMPSGHSECSDSRMTCVSSIDKFCCGCLSASHKFRLGFALATYVVELSSGRGPIVDSRRGIVLRSSNEPQALRVKFETKVILFLSLPQHLLQLPGCLMFLLNVVGHFHFILDKATSQGVLDAIYG